MSITKTSAMASALVLGVAVSSCAATESVGFRHMTAADHERAAQSGQDQTGATAAEHLQAARDLRAAEQAACAEVPDIDRDQGPFVRRDRIMAIEEIRDRVYPKQPKQTFGVAVYIRATPGTTEQWVGRVIQCHLAHYAVIGTAGAPETSLLLTAGARISVSSTQVGFRVSVTSADIDVARQLLGKGRSLVANAS
jgi:hypothetical protein